MKKHGFDCARHRQTNGVIQKGIGTLYKSIGVHAKTLEPTKTHCFFNNIGTTHKTALVLCRKAQEPQKTIVLIRKGVGTNEKAKVYNEKHRAQKKNYGLNVKKNI